MESKNNLNKLKGILSPSLLPSLIVLILALSSWCLGNMYLKKAILISIAPWLMFIQGVLTAKKQESLSKGIIVAVITIFIPLRQITAFSVISMYIVLLSTFTGYLLTTYAYKIKELTSKDNKDENETKALHSAKCNFISIALITSTHIILFPLALLIPNPGGIGAGVVNFLAFLYGVFCTFAIPYTLFIHGFMVSKKSLCIIKTAIPTLIILFGWYATLTLFIGYATLFLLIRPILFEIAGISIGWIVVKLQKNKETSS